VPGVNPHLAEEIARARFIGRIKERDGEPRPRRHRCLRLSQDSRPPPPLPAIKLHVSQRFLQRAISRFHLRRVSANESEIRAATAPLRGIIESRAATARHRTPRTLFHEERPPVFIDGEWRSRTKEMHESMLARCLFRQVCRQTTPARRKTPEPAGRKAIIVGTCVWKNKYT